MLLQLRTLRPHRTDLISHIAHNQSQNKQLHTVFQPPHRESALRQAVRDIAISCDRSGDQFREHDHISSKLQKRILPAHLSPVHIDLIRQYLEGVKADPQRQPRRASPVLEPEQYRQIRAKCQDQQKLFPPQRLRTAFCQMKTQKIIAQYRYH